MFKTDLCVLYGFSFIYVIINTSNYLVYVICKGY